MIDLLIIFSLIAAGGAVITFAAGMFIDCAIAAAVWAALIAAATILAARSEGSGL